MIAEEPTSTTIKKLKTAGFTPNRRMKGSHQMYVCPHGQVSIPISSGHRTTSPGVVRKVNTAIKKCQTSCT